MSVVEGRADIKDLLLESIQPELGASSDLRGGGWSILWREEGADRWSWFIRKKVGIKSEKPTKASATGLGYGLQPSALGGRADAALTMAISAFDPKRT